MKKNILIFCGIVAVLSVMACDYGNKGTAEIVPEEPIMSEEIASNIHVPEKVKNRIFSDFIYDVGPRFNHIKKEDLVKATSFNDFIGKEHAQRIVSYSSLSITVRDGDQETNMLETDNKDGILTVAQIELLQSAEYSSNILIRADYREKNVETGQVENSQWTPYLTVVPEKQAFFISGKDVLMDYLKNQSEEARANVNPDKLQPAKMFFTVTKDGVIKNVKLDRTSGYPEVDKTMIELILKTKGGWESAENTKGEKVDQELVVSFGLMGC